MKLDRKGFWATDLGKCPTRIFFAFKQPEKQRLWDADEDYILRKAIAIHERKYAIWEKRGILVAKEDDLYVLHEDKDISIAGVPDCILRLKEGLVVNDVKTLSQRRFTGLHGFLPPHHLQLCFYIRELRRNWKVSNVGKLYYVNRENEDQVKVVSINFDEYKEELEKEIASLKLLKKMIDKNIMPDRRYKSWHFECSWCRFNQLCQSFVDDYKEEM